MKETPFNIQASINS